VFLIGKVFLRIRILGSVSSLYGFGYYPSPGGGGGRRMRGKGKGKGGGGEYRT
jgi:hypothetical protein